MSADRSSKPYARGSSTSSLDAIMEQLDIRPKPHSARSNQTTDTPYAVLRPIGPYAEGGFSDAVSYIKRTHNYRPSSIKWTNNTSLSSPFQTKPWPQYIGLYTISFTDPPPRPDQGWRFGRGTSGEVSASRGVEFLACDPTSQSCSNFGQVDFSLRMHPQSGLLVLVPGPSPVPMAYKDFQGRRVSLRDGQYIRSVAMYGVSNTISIGAGIEYELTYCQPRDQSSIQDFVGQRNQFLNMLMRFPSPILPCWPPMPLPVQSMHGVEGVCQTILYRKFFGQDDHRCWFQGLDVETGAPHLVKQTSVAKNRAVIAQISQEIELLQRFQPKEGVLLLKSAWCNNNRVENGKLVPQLRGPPWQMPSTIYMTFDFGYPLTQLFFHKVSERMVHDLFYWLLKGVSNLHRKGIMHRNITVHNLHILREFPAYAAISDLAQAKSCNFDTSTDFVSLHSTAPEVFPQNSDIHKAWGYDKKIDVYSLGFAIARLLGFKIARPNKPITREIHRTLEEFLERFRKEHPHFKELVTLLLCMIAWNPAGRPEARFALYWPCWNLKKATKRNAQVVNEGNGEPPAKKARQG